MTYTAPGPTDVDFDFTSTSYSVPGSTDVDFNFGADISVGLTDPDAAEILTVGAIYYRRLVMPIALEVTTIIFEVGQTVPTAQITGRLYLDSAGAIGALITSSPTQTGTTADTPDDLILATPYVASAGQALWVAIEVAVTNVAGKIKTGGKGKKNGIDVPNAYAIWLEGRVIPAAVPLIDMGGDLSISEGAAGTTVFSFDVTRQQETGVTTTVDWAVTGTGTDPAAASDFIGAALPSGTVTFNPGDTLLQIVVNVAGDTTAENDETFTVTLSNPSGGATLGNTTALGTILNDDSAVTLTFTAAVSVQLDAVFISGGTEYPLGLDLTLSPTATLERATAKPLLLTLSPAPALQRDIASAVQVDVAPSVSIVRAIAHGIGINLIPEPQLDTTQAIGLSLQLSVSPLPYLARETAKIVTARADAAVALQRATERTLSLSVGPSALLAAGRSFGTTLVAAAGIDVALGRSISKVLDLRVEASATLDRVASRFRTFTLSVAAAVLMNRGLEQTLELEVRPEVRLGTARTIAATLTARVTAALDLIRGYLSGDAANARLAVLPAEGARIIILPRESSRTGTVPRETRLLAIAREAVRLLSPDRDAERVPSIPAEGSRVIVLPADPDRVPIVPPEG